MGVKVIKAGLLTTVQDGGRSGYQKYGVPVSGAMDSYSYSLANILVNNDEREAVLEASFMGPALKFTEDSLISVTGADLSPSINGYEVPMWHPVRVTAGSVLEFGSVKSGCRAYIAVAGGFDVPLVMASRSTYIKAAIGGYEGRALREGDELKTGSVQVKHRALAAVCDKNEYDGFFSTTTWFFPHDHIPAKNKPVLIETVDSAQTDEFSEEALVKFYGSTFKITNLSDRMGYRLEGEKIELKKKSDMLSEAVAFGTVQITAGGDPIILMADRQTTGGYPKIAQVTLTSLPVVAQAAPGAVLKFVKISLKKAGEEYIARRNYIAALKETVNRYAEGEHKKNVKFSPDPTLKLKNDEDDRSD